jgi:hypothetical protein
MANRRDLHVGIDADDRGFGQAFEDAQDKARGLDKELAKLERQQAAQEKVTQRTTAAVERYARAEDKAALAARRKGMEAKRAAEQAERAEVRAAAAAEAAAKGMLDEEKAARIAARADDAVERAALKAAEAQLAEAAAAEALAKAERDAAGGADRHGASIGRTRGLLVSAGAAAAALAVPLGAAGLAFVGMAAVAAPAVAKVISAQADLGANWDTLDANQKVAASSVAALISEYKALAKSYEPDALREFNGLVSTARGLLPTLDKTVASTRAGFADFATSVENTANRQIPRLAGILQGQATPALHELGVTADQTAGLAVNLVQGLAPMGLTLLTSANGALRLLNVLTSIDPRLTELAFTAVALRAPTNALGKLWSDGASKLTGFASKAGKAEGVLGKLGKIAGNSPNLYIGAALALGYLAVRMNSVQDSTDKLIQSFKIQDNAFGNNAAGYRAMANDAGRAAAAQRALQQSAAANAKTTVNASRLTREAGNTYDGYAIKIQKLDKAQRDAIQTARNIERGEAAVKAAFTGAGGAALDLAQANQLATAAGVDLSKALDKTGNLTPENAAKIRAYTAAVARAANPTQRIAEDMKLAANSSLLMQDRVAALDDALAAYFGPASDAWNATTQLKAGFDDLASAMKKAHGNFSGNTAASQGLRNAFDQELRTVYALRNATLAQTGDLGKANAAAAGQVQVMYALARGNKDATAEVDALANSLGVTVGAANLSHGAFIKAAASMGVNGRAAEALWRAYQKLQKPVKLSVDDAEFMSALHEAQGLKLDPKTGKFLGNNADYFNKWLKAKGLRIDPKTGKFLGNNADYYNKWLKANGLHIDTKTGVIKGNTSRFWAAVHAIPTTVATRYVDLATRTKHIGPRYHDPHGATGGLYTGREFKRGRGYAVGGEVSGYLTGPGTGTSDSIPAPWLANGEYIVNARSTAMWRPLLDAINSGRRVPVAAAPVISGASGGAARPVQVTQNIFQPQDPHVAARESARELAWMLRG